MAGVLRWKSEAISNVGLLSLSSEQAVIIGIAAIAKSEKAMLLIMFFIELTY